MIEDRMTNQTVAQMLESKRLKAEQGNWVPACGGTETPFVTRTGRRLLYCWQPSTGKHAYLDLGSDFFLSNEDAQLALGTF
jgi:hypothetical protein